MSRNIKRSDSRRTRLQVIAIVAILAGGASVVSTMGAYSDSVDLVSFVATASAPIVAGPSGDSDARIVDVSRGEGAIALRKSGPNVSSDGLTWDFGQWEVGNDLSHTFVLRNDGDMPLHIVRAKPG